MSRFGTKAESHVCRGLVATSYSGQRNGGKVGVEIYRDPRLQTARYQVSFCSFTRSMPAGTVVALFLAERWVFSTGKNEPKALIFTARL